MLVRRRWRIVSNVRISKVVTIQSNKLSRKKMCRNKLALVIIFLKLYVNSVYSNCFLCLIYFLHDFCSLVRMFARCSYRENYYCFSFLNLLADKIIINVMVNYPLISIVLSFIFF